MTSEARGDHDARQVLSRNRELAHRVRREQQATWFPLLTLALVTFLAIPVERYGHRSLTCRSVSGLPLPTGQPGRICAVSSTASFVYWAIALVVAYAAIAAFYVHRERVRGVGTRIGPYVVTGVVIAVLMTGLAIWAAHNPPAGEQDFLGLHFRPQDSPLFSPLVGPTAAIGLALLVLAWVERNIAALAVAIVYLVIVLGRIDFGWVVAHPLPWYFLPHLVIAGLVLAVAGLGFLLVHRSARSSAP